MDDGTILFWAFINHKGDVDIKKDHVHVYVIPSSRIDTVSFNERFVEIDPGNALPLRLQIWRFSKWDDWYLYAIHDPDYLEMKGQKRNYRYSREEIHCSDHDQMDYMISTIDYGQIFSLTKIISAAEAQMPIAQALREGIIPPGKVTKYMNVFKIIKYDSRPYEDNLDKKYKGVK